MNRRKTGLFTRNCLTLLIPLVLALSPLTALPKAYSQSSPQSLPAGELSVQELDKMLAIAETRLNIVKLLIAQGKFDRVLPEMKVIFQINLPDKCDGQVTDAALIAAKLLVDQSQYEIAHKVLDEAFLRVKANADKARLLQFKAGIFKLEGKLDKALTTWELALTYIKKQIQ
jgi:tetratricopeptide (TPR) repeat protein